jgi:uncharacterized SAM-binding protein YcdF (DUF218 family)
MFIVGKILQAIVLPPGIFVAGLVILAVLSARAKRRAPAVLAASLAAILYACSIDPIAGALIRPLEKRWPALEDPGIALARGVTDIVALGGGLLPRSPEYGGKASLAGPSVHRASTALRISRETGLPLIFSGGSRNEERGEESEAEAAGRFWLGLGADPSRIRLETRSRDTDENARFVAEMVGKGPVILVTSASHMPRAVLAFNKAGIDVIPAPTDFHANSDASIRVTDPMGWLPSAKSLELSSWALHEYIGLLYYAVK